MKKVAKECLAKYGVRKTTVDEIVQLTGISKGSFYNFYPSKETLFFKVSEDYQKALVEDFLSTLKRSKPIGVSHFTDAIYQLYQRVRGSFMMTIIENNELDYLLRKIPQELIFEHHSLDALLADKIFFHIHLKENVSKDTVMAALRAVFISLIHVDAVGEEYYNDALKLLIRGLALQIIEEG